MLDLKSLKHNFQAWKIAQYKNEDFIELVHPSNLVLGTSFIPERFGLENENQLRAMKVLRVLIEDLGFREVRLGIRWNSVEKTQGKFDLAFYEKFLDYLTEKNIRVCLNLGPIKSCGWPEDHMPSWISESGLLPKRGAWILASSEIANIGLVYFEQLLARLKNYQKNGLHIYQIQPENEAFNPFGTNRFKFEQNYLMRQCELISNYFPSIKVLMNSNGRFDLNRILGLVGAIQSASQLNLRPTIGYDYYYTDQWRGKVPFHKYFDSASLSLPFDPTLERLNQRSLLENFELEVTEAQFEPWTYLTDPGNKLADLKFVIHRCVFEILALQKQKFVRLWGTEQLAEKILDKKTNDEHEQMIYLIKNLNHLT
jgi:hypothetical protein